MRLLNIQYIQFILDHVVRPYQGMLGYEKRIERLLFVSSSNPTSINYADLIVLSNTNKFWFDHVIMRLAKCYEAIDFSFFPNEAFADELKKALLNAGIKEINYFDNSIYANNDF